MGERADVMSDDRNVDEIRDDIEQNRDAMERTIDQLEARLNPDALQTQVSDIVRQVTDQLMAEFESKAQSISTTINEQVQSAVHGAATARTEQLFSDAEAFVIKFGKTLWQRIADNPAPLALAATAVGLLAAEGPKERNGASGNEGIIQQMTSTMKDSVLGLKNEVTSLTDRTRESAGNVADGAGQQAAQLSQKALSVSSLWEDQPLAIGLLAAGVGFVAAVTVPQSKQERQMLAPAVDKAQAQLDQMGVTDSTGQGEGGLVGQAKKLGSDVIGQAKEVVGDQLSQVKEAAASATRTESSDQTSENE